MNYVKTYNEFLNESAQIKNADVTGLERLLKLPQGSGVFQDVSYDDKTKTLVITQPKNLAPLDAGAVMGAISKETAALKRNYVGLRTVSIGDIKIAIK